MSDDQHAITVLDNDELHFSIVKLRGLPWSCTVEDIKIFFEECEIADGSKGIHIVRSRDNRSTGEAYVELASTEDLAKALLKDRNHIGSRYIEVMRTRKSEFEWALRRQINGRELNQDAVVKLRGLPFDCTKEEVSIFFEDLEIISNGVLLVTDSTGRSNGEAFVQFATIDAANSALKKHREKIGHRYIEIFRSSAVDLRRYCDSLHCSCPYVTVTPPKVMPQEAQMPPRFGTFDRNVYRINSLPNVNRGGNRTSSYNDFSKYDTWHPPMQSNVERSSSMQQIPNEMARMGRGRLVHDRGARVDGGASHGWLPSGAISGGFGDNVTHYIRMRGLPFKARTADIINFFKPITPINVSIKYESSGRATGEADVQFASQFEAFQAMQKDKGHMRHRYIELFLNTNVARKPREMVSNDPYKSTTFY